MYQQLITRPRVAIAAGTPRQRARGRASHRRHSSRSRAAAGDDGEPADAPPAASRQLTPQLERQLRLMFEHFWPVDGERDVAGFASAFARWVFREELLLRPTDEGLQRQGVALYPTSERGDVRPVRVRRRSR